METVYVQLPIATHSALVHSEMKRRTRYHHAATLGDHARRLMSDALNFVQRDG